MKTTVEIADGLFAQAKVVAARRKVTMREIIEEGLRQVIEHASRSQPKFHLKDGAFHGDGMLVGVGPEDWRELAYDRDRR